MRISSDVNQFVLTGRLTKDPVFRLTKTGKEMLRFSIAVNNYYRKDDEVKRSTSYFNIFSWEKQAVFLQGILKKGFLVTVMGKLSANMYQDQQSGQSRMSYMLTANQVVINFPKKEKENTFGREANDDEPVEPSW